MSIPVGEGFQVERRAGAKAQRWVCAWWVGGMGGGAELV